MRDLNPELEQQFFDLFADYYDQERSSGNYSKRSMSTERMLPLAKLAGHPENKLKVIHIAGTKGKGSTTFLAAELLHSASYRVGCFTSPHLATVRERFQINNELISYECLLNHAAELRKKLEMHNLHPTLFEIMTILSLQIFAEAQCDYAVLETGIGGLLDATNFISNPVCTAITSISYDHVHILGNTITAIASQKAGIIKFEVPIVCGKQPYSAAEQILQTRAQELNAPFIKIEPDALPQVWRKFLEGKPFFQIENFATAFEICRTIGIQPVPDAFRYPELRARFEVVQQSPPIIIDAAHNVDSAQKTTAAIRNLYPGMHFTVILGVIKSKNAHGIFEVIREIADEMILTDPLSPKGSKLNLLVSLARKNGVPYQILHTIDSREQLPSDKPLLFTGSFFTAVIGERLFH